jgi:hypothetical protein
VVSVGFTWSDCDPIFRRLYEEELRPIIVGGQAVNLWVDYYHPSLGAGRAPIASKDIDVLSEGDLAQRCARALNARYRPVNRSREATPMSAIVVLGENDDALRIDFLDCSEPNPVEHLLRDAVRLPTAWGEVSVMHPLHCMKSRIYNVMEIWQGGVKKYDTVHGLAQMKAAMDVVKLFARERLNAEGGVRKVLKIYEEIFEFGLSPLGQKLWDAKGVDVMSCVEPLPELPTEFLSKRYPQMLGIAGRGTPEQR